MGVIVGRSSWGAAADLGEPMTLPAREVWLHHSVTPVTSDPRADMRAIERVGLERFGIISYSWAFHPDGTVLEGAGFTKGAHTGGRNSISFGLVLIGDYTDREPTRAQLDAVAGLIRDLVAVGLLRPGTYPTGGHRQLKATECPGDRAFARLDELRQLVATQQPPAAIPEEDDMTFIRKRSNGHTAIVVAGKVIPVTGPNNWSEAEKGGVPRVVLDDDEYDRLVRALVVVPNR